MEELIPSLVPRPRRLRFLDGTCRPSVGEDGRPELITRLVPELFRGAAEGYRLRCDKAGLVVEAGTEAGLAHGMTTLRQILSPTRAADSPAGKFPIGELPALEIEDAPRFSWRGLHLDVVRHFFSAEQVCRAIDWCAEHKLNRFHWHLTDDQGWRLPVPTRPRLTEIAAWREEPNGVFHGGAYTEAEIRSVLTYAAARHVVIVPEIEMPGHARAALAAYPELSCTGIAQPVPATWGIFEDVFCAGNEAVFEFLEEVLSETARLFPGPYLHVGGDEVPKTRWLSCPRCRALMEREGLGDGEALQSWFLRRVARIVEGLGRTLVGWDEILEGGAPAGSVVLSWRGFEGASAAARVGLDAVLCPTTHCYLDSYQGPRETEPFAFPREVLLETAYAFDPSPADRSGLSDSESAHILGGQACIWTEYMEDWERVEYMAFPRLCALAEALWTPVERKDYAGFLRRMRRHEERLRGMGIRPHPLAE